MNAKTTTTNTQTVDTSTDRTAQIVTAYAGLNRQQRIAALAFAKALLARQEGDAAECDTQLAIAIAMEPRATQMMIEAMNAAPQ